MKVNCLVVKLVVLKAAKRVALKAGLLDVLMVDLWDYQTVAQSVELRAQQRVV